MKQSEKLIERRLREHVERLGGVAVKLPTLHFIGLPDRLILLPGGRAMFVETKTTGDKRSKAQLYVGRKLEALGFAVHQIDKTEQIEKLIK